MAKCACGEDAGWFRFECSACEEKEKQKWLKEHSFVFGEEVELVIDGCVFGKGKISNKKVHPGDDYTPGCIEYAVLLPDGTVHTYLSGEIRKCNG